MQRKKKIHGVYLGIISSCCIIICTEQDKKNIQSREGIKRCSQSSPNNYQSEKWFPFITLNVNIAFTAKPGRAELVLPLRVTAQRRQRSREATGSIRHAEPSLKPPPLLWRFQPYVPETCILPGKQRAKVEGEHATALNIHSSKKIIFSNTLICLNVGGGAKQSLFLFSFLHSHL